MYKRAINIVPQLDGTYNVSDDSDIDTLPIQCEIDQAEIP